VARQLHATTTVVRFAAVNHMTKPRSDAFVFFGATGDLAYKKIFPALQAISRRNGLDFLVVGVAKSGWTRDQLIERARASIAEHGVADEEAFSRMTAQLRYVDGDYNDADTFARLRAELNGRVRPLHYLAIPPTMFATVIAQLRR
jgi:glucose-6-phosphate 1-dehydrogenase